MFEPAASEKAPRIIAFAGPCLPRRSLSEESGSRRPGSRWRAALDGVELWPPARRGDILRALGRRPHVLVLLDGLYYSVPSVTHKELLYALDSGVALLGAASMGALRAAEMAPFGMVGTGHVFEQFRDGALDGDDEVAMLHTLAEDGYRPITLALVEVRHALAEILAEDDRPARAGDAFLAAVKALPLTARSRDRHTDLGGEHLPEIDIRRVLERVARDGIKERDALEALEAAPRLAPGTRRRRGPLITTLLDQIRGGVLGPFPTEPCPTEPSQPEPPETSTGAARREPATYLQAWQVTQLFHPGAADFLDRVRRRFLLASAARALGLRPLADAVDEVTAELEVEIVDLPLPRLELEAEVELEVLAREGAERVRDAAPEDDLYTSAAAILAPRFGLERRGALERLMALMAVQGDLLRPWAVARALLFTGACRPALLLAEAAFQVQRAWSAHSRGGRLTRRAVSRVAGEIFGCAAQNAEAEGARRGLLTHTEGEASTGTLAEAIALVAAAERLPRPVNDYTRRRDALIVAPLDRPGLV